MQIKQPANEFENSGLSRSTENAREDRGNARFRDLEFVPESD
jgi:hypothetical protein